MKREIVLDTETTGFDPNAGHRIVEIGCVELLGGIRTGKFFHCYFNPERDMPDEAFRVHGLSSEFLKEKPVFSQKIDELLEFLADSTLVIHNAGFDMKFVNFEVSRLGFPILAMERAIDTVMMAKKKFPGAPASLDALCKRFSIDLSARTKHGALLDAELLSDVYLELLGGRQVSLGLDAKMGLSEDGSLTVVTKTYREPRSFVPSDEELALHAQMLSGMKAPIWTAE
jgi:DNA polymerase-3 subunit epsilon